MPLYKVAGLNSNAVKMYLINDDSINLANLLEIMDGVMEMSGRIMIISTNYPEKLDKALVRPGRMDLKIEFKKCNNEILESIYENCYKGHVKEKLYQEGLEILKEIPDYSVSPAEVNKEILDNPWNPVKAIGNLKLAF